jgi:hypothetical protein
MAIVREGLRSSPAASLNPRLNGVRQRPLRPQFEYKTWAPIAARRNQSFNLSICPIKSIPEKASEITGLEAAEQRATKTSTTMKEASAEKAPSSSETVMTASAVDATTAAGATESTSATGATRATEASRAAGATETARAAGTASDVCTSPHSTPTALGSSTWQNALELGHLGLEFLPLARDGDFGAGIHAGAQMFKSVLVDPAIERCLLLVDTSYRVL